MQRNRYIKPGRVTPVFHVMGLLFVTGVLLEARVHSARVKDGAHH